MSNRGTWVSGFPPPVVLLTLGIFAIPYTVNLGVSSIWDANEAFYAGTPREMIESGDYLAPRFNYEVRAQKPPLTYWLVAGAYRLFGITEASVRLPGTLAAIGTILLTFAMARRVASSPYALLAASITATTPRNFILARRLPIDILLVFFLTGTAYFLWRASETSSRRDWAAAYALAALGFMTKGPVALVIPFGSYLLSSVWTYRRSMRSCRPLLGVTIFGALTLPWYVAVFRDHGWTYVSPFFLRDNLGRFASEMMGPARGPFFYVFTFLADYFPWSFLSLALLALQALEWRTVLTRLRESRLVFAIVWCVMTFVLFSLSRNKQEYYIARQMFSMIIPLPDISFFVWYQYITHNSIGWIWRKTGIGGFMALLFLAGLAIINGLGAVFRMPDGTMRAVALTAVLYLLMHFTFAYEDMSWESQSMVYVGAMMGIISCAERVVNETPVLKN